MRAAPLTDKSKPGGRPRETRAPQNAFATWLRKCGMTATQVASKLNVGSSTTYNIKNGFFLPGLDLAVRIEKLSKGKVPVESWSLVEIRPRKTKRKAA